MNCTELREHWNHGVGESRRESGVSTHLDHCADCRQWVETEHQLRRELQSLRELAPPVPASVDQKMLAVYRRGLSESAIATSPLPRLAMAFPVWRAAAAAVLLCGVVFLFGTRKAITPHHEAVPSQAKPCSPRQPEKAAPARSNRPMVAAKATPHHARKPERHAQETMANSLPPGFRSLMYCDELSCSGTMDVIRMELPASAFGIYSGSSQNNLVAADVVVGPDGIARAIRIVN